jgi:hypothetical protein
MMSFNPFNIETSFRSDFVPVVALKPEVQAKVDELFLKPIAESFFIKLHINYLSAEYIGFDNAITEKEFVKLETELAKSYFYEMIFTNPKKDSHKKILNRIKYCFTFDRELAQFSFDGSKYGVITLGSKPIFYYIFIDLQELIRFIKEEV